MSTTLENQAFYKEGRILLAINTYKKINFQVYKLQIRI